MTHKTDTLKTHINVIHTKTTTYRLHSKLKKNVKTVIIMTALITSPHLFQSLALMEYFNKVHKLPSTMRTLRNATKILTI